MADSSSSTQRDNDVKVWAAAKWKSIYPACPRPWVQFLNRREVRNCMTWQRVLTPRKEGNTNQITNPSPAWKSGIVKQNEAVLKGFHHYLWFHHYLSLFPHKVDSTGDTSESPRPLSNKRQVLQQSLHSVKTLSHPVFKKSKINLPCVQECTHWGWVRLRLTCILGAY